MDQGGPAGRARRLWAATWIYCCLLLASAYGAQFPLDSLRERGLLAASLNGALALAAVGGSVWLARGRPGWRELLMVAAVIAPLALFMARLEIQQERLHFLEYGALAALALAAAEAWRGVGRAPVWPRWPPAVTAVALAALCGWLDELIQALLPNRTYDPRDILLNAMAALLTVAGLRGRTLAREADRGVRLAAAARRSATTAAVLVAALLAADPAGAAAARSNVLLLTLDALRADHLGCYGYPRPTSPRIDAFAASDATRFETVIAQSAWTSPGIVSLLTGMRPAAHGMDARRKAMDPFVATPLEELAADGWRVAGFQVEGDTYANLGFSGSDLHRRPLPEVLRELAAGGEPFVLWYQLKGTHLPYAAPPELRARFRRPGSAPLPAEHERLLTEAVMIPAGRVEWTPAMRPAVVDLYDAAVRQQDLEVGAVFDLLRELGLWDSTIVVLTADHGEELLEHGLVGHASTTLRGALHEELLRIPLIIRVPGIGAGRTVRSLARQIDVMPTLFAALDRDPWPAFQGRSLLAEMDGAAASRDAPASALAETTLCGWQCVSDREKTRRVRALRGERFKLVVDIDEFGARSWRLYDLAADPGETVDARGRHPQAFRELAAELRRREDEDLRRAADLMVAVLRARRDALAKLEPMARRALAGQVCDELTTLRSTYRLQNPSLLDRRGLARRVERARRGLVELLGAAGYWACAGSWAAAG